MPTDGLAAREAGLQPAQTQAKSPAPSRAFNCLRAMVGQTFSLPDFRAGAAEFFAGLATDEASAALAPLEVPEASTNLSGNR